MTEELLRPGSRRFRRSSPTMQAIAAGELAACGTALAAYASHAFGGDCRRRGVERYRERTTGVDQPLHGLALPRKRRCRRREAIPGYGFGKAAQEAIGGAVSRSLRLVTEHL